MSKLRLHSILHKFKICTQLIKNPSSFLGFNFSICTFYLCVGGHTATVRGNKLVKYL